MSIIHSARIVICTLICARGLVAGEFVPALNQLKPDHPRLLVRPNNTPFAVSLNQLRSIPRDADYARMLRQLQNQDHAAAQAMVWLLTGDQAAADKAIRRMRAYRFPGKVDTFHIFFRLTEFGLAYDWLYNNPAFNKVINAEIRANVAPLAKEAIRNINDHMFHNYIWMSSGGLSLWAMATAGDDEASSQLFETVRNRFNRGLFPAWRYLDGLSSEPMGYWSLYVFTPGLFTVLAAQSASETDVIASIRKQENSWLDRHFENIIHSTLPDMRYIPWGDLQSGPNGGVTHDMASTIDAATWGLRSTAGLRFSNWLRDKRGLERFRAETAIFYFLYTRQLAARDIAEPAWPALSFLAGAKHSAHFIARSSWEEDATIVALRCTDHFGDHHHYDQGGFTIYSQGLLAVDPPVYRKVAGPQQPTQQHNTLLIGGKPQRQARGQWFITIEDFQKNLNAGRKLETGDMIFWHDEGGAPGWAAAAGQYAQAYDCPELKSCIRQLLFIRPDTIIVVDQLEAQPEKTVPEVQWLLQLPATPDVREGQLTASNGKSWIRCRSLIPGRTVPTIEPTPVNTQRATYTYPGAARLTLAHVLEISRGEAPGPTQDIRITPDSAGTVLTIGARKFTFNPAGPITASR